MTAYQEQKQLVGRIVCCYCGRSNWHNGWLCRECGSQDYKTWCSHVLHGYIKPRTKVGRAKAQVLREKNR